jgi:2-succinyl-5-enolpyruvyl-6-hydroxy-3-cyclohexene-1-carboxylate synthase
VLERFLVDRSEATSHPHKLKLKGQTKDRGYLNDMNQLWGYLIIEELVRNGVDYFVISPGSRSTPLTVAVARNPKASHIICIDERAAAFHAIGYARAKTNPAVLICTSGTAAANYLPAVIEAATDDLPLIILSADRPPELRYTGANQTINQVSLYGTYPTWQFDLPCPTAEINPQVVLTTIDLAVSRSRQSPGGVVHLNCMFREPLAPTAEPVEIPASLSDWHQRNGVYTSYAEKLNTVSESQIQQLVAHIIKPTIRGVLIVGQLKDPESYHWVIKLAQRLNWAVVADIQSGLRLRRDIPNLIHYFDRLLLTDKAVELASIDTIIQIGSRIVSAGLLKWLAKHSPTNYVMVLDNGDRDDPNHQLTLRIESDISLFCQQLINNGFQCSSTEWVQKLRSTSQSIGLIVADFLNGKEKLSEPWVARTISELIPAYYGLWIANSMPIRDLDMYGSEYTNNPRIGANRGTSGIEGSIAAATGFAIGLEAPVTAVVGDLSALHDLNSLALLSKNYYPVIAIIINNNGGGIFSFLPLAKSLLGKIAKSTDVFEPYFGTPHGLNFDRAAAMFGLAYYHPQIQTEFIEYYTQCLATNKSAIIEITTDRQENWQLHQDIQEEIQQKIS